VGIFSLSKLLRGGRLGSSRRDVVEYTSSIAIDQKLLGHVIRINEAHMAMVVEQKIVNRNDGAKILQALKKLEKRSGLPADAEDIHMAVEEEVNKAVGDEVGGNLHIAKSRNDQVSVAIRMQLREELLELVETLSKTQRILINMAKKHVNTLFLGYTHSQPAQPITFAHYLLSHADALERDLDRLREAYGRVNLSPMGAGALATTSFPIDRERVAELLGFDGVIENSLDAVGSRDFILETLAELTLLSTNLGRFVGDLITLSSADVGLLEIPEEFTSTSSIMPQKKNPELLEVIRARLSYILADFTACVSIVKGLPSGYSLDLQEVTPKIWESMKNIVGSLHMLSKLIPNLTVREEAVEKKIGFTTSTELANLLVRRFDIPFRKAHRIVGSLTKKLMENGLTLRGVTPEVLKAAAKKFTDRPIEVGLGEIQASINPAKFIQSHRVLGGPSPKEVQRMIKSREKRLLADSEKWLKTERMRLAEAEGKLKSLVDSY